MPRYDRLMRRASRKSAQAQKARSKGKFRKADRKSAKASKLRSKARGSSCGRGSRPVRNRSGRVTGYAVDSGIYRIK